ncbi:MAG: hypothetical protein JWQ69_5714 [Pseudomonas sp.]|nr:hypothetical protein [Pseudomonas sp.]
MIVPTLCVVTPSVTLCVTTHSRQKAKGMDAERRGQYYHAERGNDQVIRV